MPGTVLHQRRVRETAREGENLRRGEKSISTQMTLQDVTRHVGKRGKAKPARRRHGRGRLWRRTCRGPLLRRWVLTEETRASHVAAAGRQGAGRGGGGPGVSAGHGVAEGGGQSLAESAYWRMPSGRCHKMLNEMDNHGGVGGLHGWVTWSD